MPYKKNSSGAGAAANITSNTLSSSIDTTNPLLPKLKLKSVIDQSGTLITSNDLLIDLETINNTGSNLAGDVTGAVGANTVTKIQNVAVASTAPTNGQVLQFNGTNYVPTTPAAGGGISNDLGQRLILGSDNKAFEDISGHLVHIETLQEKISFSFDPKTAKPTAGASAGGYSAATPNTGYFGSFVSFLYKFESANITLPTLPVGYSYLSVINIHCLVNNGSQQPYPFKVLVDGTMNGGTNFGGTDSQCAYILPPMTAELAPNYSNNPSLQLSTYQAKNFSIERDINYQSNTLLSQTFLAGNQTKFMGEMSFILPCEGGQAFLKFNNNIEVQELKYEICFYAMKNAKINQTGTITTPTLQI